MLTRKGGTGRPIVLLLHTLGQLGRPNAPQIMRLVLEAPGWAGRFCAPREMLVERMLKTEEGMHVVLFSSVEEEAVSTTSSSCESSSTRKGRGNHRRSLYRRPVVGWVRGTYAIAPLENETLQSSNEALITCIIKVRRILEDVP